MEVKKEHWSLQYLPFITEDTIFDESNKLVQLDKDSKVPIAGVPNVYEKYSDLDGSGYSMKSDDFEPFEDPTGIICNYYSDYGLYLCVLDFDEFSERDEVIKNFKYKDTYCRRSPHGYHFYYFSPVPRKYVQNKDKLKIDFKMCSAVNPNSLGGFVRFYPEYKDNGLPVMEIDVNEVIRELYESNNVPLVEQSSNVTNSFSFEVEKDLEVSPYIEAIALYFYYKIRAVNPKWVSGYDYSFKLGLKLSGYIDTKQDANAFANRLMELSGYSKPYQWIQNFMNGYMTGDSVCKNNFSGKKLTRLAIDFYINKNLTIDEYAKKMYKYDLDSYLTVIKTVLKKRGD